MRLRPIKLREAAAFVAAHHRHHPPAKGWKFGIGLVDDAEKLIGVIVVARPIARLLDNGWTAEVTRCCTDGTRNACSMLYGAARRAAFAMGYRRLITYILEGESGSSLKASGFVFDGETRGESWDRPCRKRTDSAPTCPKQRWHALNPLGETTAAVSYRNSTSTSGCAATKTIVKSSRSSRALR